MRRKELNSKVEELVDALQQRVDLFAAKGVSWLEHEAESNYSRLQYLQDKAPENDSLPDWLHSKREASENLEKIEKQIDELEQLATEWEKYFELFTDTKLGKHNI